MDASDWTRTVPSDRTAGQTYTVKAKQGLYSCSCPAWRMQRSPIDRRTCKHLIRILGAEHEKQRAPESFYGLTRMKRTEPRPQAPEFMSYQTWNPRKLPPQTLDQWFYSVKLDGAWGRWSDGRLVTKSGRELHPPTRITDRLPRDIDLDGEIYHPDRQRVRKAVLADRWDDEVEFVVFDVFDTTQPFSHRWNRLQHYHQRHRFKMAPQHRFQAPDWPALETRIRQQKEEGLVLHDPEGLYEPGRRSATTLKWKPRSAGQARIEACQPKKIGTRLTLRELAPPSDATPSTFAVYSRRSPEQFRIGDIVTFTYTGRDERARPEGVSLGGSPVEN